MPDVSDSHNPNSPDYASASSTSYSTSSPSSVSLPSDEEAIAFVENRTKLTTFYLVLRLL